MYGLPIDIWHRICHGSFTREDGTSFNEIINIEKLEAAEQTIILDVSVRDGRST